MIHIGFFFSYHQVLMAFEFNIQMLQMKMYFKLLLGTFVQFQAYGFSLSVFSSVSWVAAMFISCVGRSGPSESCWERWVSAASAVLQFPRLFFFVFSVGFLFVILGFCLHSEVVQPR